MRLLYDHDPPPMPGVRDALLDVTEARKALERAELAWNRSQLQDALRSARFFIDAAEKKTHPLSCRGGGHTGPVAT